MLTAGIDIGSITTKVAVLDGRNILGTDLGFTGYNPDKSWREVYTRTLERLGLQESAISRIVSTGYGRQKVGIATKKITEIVCHAEGARHFLPAVRAVIDIGGQDSKFIRIGAHGDVAEFVMNDKCSAGTGRFLEVMARALEVGLDEFGEISAAARKPARISNTCTVFAESEVISLIAQGETRENIVAGLHQSIASRIVTMMGAGQTDRPIVMTGGVARNAGMRRALEAALGTPLEVADTAQLNGAIGAAVLAQSL
jgi:predicted CoA-substrate-specific enzyme activase